MIKVNEDERTIQSNKFVEFSVTFLAIEKCFVWFVERRNFLGCWSGSDDENENNFSIQHNQLEDTNLSSIFREIT